MQKYKFKRIIALFTAASVAATVYLGCSQTSTEESEDYESDSSLSSETAIADDEVLSASKAVMVSVYANETEGELVSADTSFTIVTEDDVEVSTLANTVAISPDVDFTIEKKSECNFVLKTEEPLPENSMTVLSMKDDNGEDAYRWAFQTKGPFEVKETYPSDGASYVAADTGIEISFTANISESDADEYFEIYPQVPGNFYTHRSTLYFMPSTGLSAGQQYTVTMKEGFASADGIVLEEDKKFSFKVSDSNRISYCYALGESETFVQGDSIVVEMHCSDELMYEDFNVNLYEYAAADDYYNALKGYIDSGTAYDDYEFSKQGLQNVYSSVDNLLLTNNTWSDAGYIMLPEELDNGYYFAEITCQTVSGYSYTVKRHIQVSPVSVYSSFIYEKGQFFVNDINTGGAASSAQIELYTNEGVFSAKTDSQGLADMEITVSNSGTGLLKITYGADVFCEVYNYYNGAEPDIGSYYYAYIYTDRSLYKTEDTVNIWGLIRPRNDSIAIPDDLTLRFGYEDNGWDIPFELNPDGTFSAQTTYTDLNVEWGTSVSLQCGDQTICRTYISINDYIKPDYQFEVDIPVYAVSPQSVPVDISVDAALFDGTAADDLTFEVSGYYVSDAYPYVIVTDENGHAESSVLFEDTNSWQPYSYSVDIKLAGVENEYTEAYASTIGLSRDIMLEYEYDEDNKTVEIATSKIDTSRITAGDNCYSEEFYDKIRGESVDVEINAYLECNWTEKIEDGSFYDFLQKKTIKTYSYESRSEFISAFSFNTSNGKAVLNNLFDGTQNRPNCYYVLTLEWFDSQGRYTTQNIYLYNSDYANYTSTYKHYVFECSGNKYSSEWYQNEFTVNQKMGFSLINTNDPNDTAQGRVLFQVCANDFIDSTVYDSRTFTHTMKAEYVPSFELLGAFFDGRHVYPIYQGYGNYNFNPEKREIIIKISPDKDEYLPSQEASVTISAKDINGDPVKGASVVLSVVDEAAFAVSSQVADPLGDIYNYVNPGYSHQYYSYIQYSLDDKNTGEGGGGEDTPTTRKNFKDTAAFLTAITDENGNAVFEFELPDNITQWRATALAVYEKETDKVYAGTSKHSIVVTQPIFIEPVMLSQIVEGDDFSASARCFGDEAQNNEITVNVSGNGVNLTKTAPSGVLVNFGKLEKGEYTVKFSASASSASDSVELPLVVVDSLLETSVINSFDLAEGVEISPTSWPMDITFFDAEHMFYTEVLNSLIGSPSARLDMRIAEDFALTELGFSSTEQFLSEYEGITSTGLAALLPSSSSSVELTARICAATPELADKTNVKRVMYETLDSQESYSTQVSSAYLALAAFGEPVLTEIRYILKNNTFSDEFSGEGFSLDDGLRLTAALALLGDYDTASKYYEEFTQTRVEDKTEDDEKIVYIEGEGSNPLGLTASAILTASIIRHEDADAMARYIISQSDIYDSYSLELVTYLRHYNAQSDEIAKLEYNLDGKTETIELNRHFGTSVSLNEEQFADADFEVISGSVYAVSNYNGHPLQNDTDPTLDVTKTVSGDFTPGGLVTVTIFVGTGDNRYADDYYVINDVIPSCARYVESDYNYARANGQQVTVYTDEYGYAYYSFRICANGNYVLESACARNSEGEWGVSERSEISVE